MLSGRCECRAVRYRVADEFLYAANCHCSNCRAGQGLRSSRLPASSGTSSESSREPTDCSSGATIRPITRGAASAAPSSTRSCGTVPTCTSRWALSRTSRASARRAHLRRLKGTVVRDHGRLAAVGGVLRPVARRVVHRVRARACEEGSDSPKPTRASAGPPDSTNTFAGVGYPPAPHLLRVRGREEVTDSGCQRLRQGLVVGRTGLGGLPLGQRWASEARAQRKRRRWMRGTRRGTRSR